MNDSPDTFATRRRIAATPARIFAALSTPERLARWFGPAGFRNEFLACDLREGGRWQYIMHGPTGKHFANESEFVVLDAPHRWEIRHVSQPHYRLTIELVPVEDGTELRWTQVFEDAEVARKVAGIVVPANEENIDRLTAEVLSPPQP